MLPEDPWHKWCLKVLGYGLFAMFGGTMGYLMRSINDRRKITWSHAILEGGAAGFVGLLMALACQAMNLSEQWTGVIVGISGWLGANATIRMLESIVLKKLGIEKQIAGSIQERRDDHISTD